MENQNNVAILIDAENVSPAWADEIFAKANELGTITVKDIFGTAPALTAWVYPVMQYVINTHLTVRAMKGKNSSDISLVIGAMDVLLKGSAQTVVIVSSDSDFSALSFRLRSGGVNVVGMGMEDTNSLWKTACSSFIPLGQLPAEPVVEEKKPAAPVKPQEKPKREKPSDTELASRQDTIRRFIESQMKRNNGRMRVSTLFQMLNRLPAYIAEKKRVIIRKPQQYLTSHFSDIGSLEMVEDVAWFVAPNSAPVAAEAPVEAEPLAEEPVPEEEPAVEEEPIAVQEAPAAEPEAPAGNEQMQFVQVLSKTGIAEDVCGQIWQILSECKNMRVAYNRLRKNFGGVGTDYYHKVKAILEQAQEQQ